MPRPLPPEVSQTVAERVATDMGKKLGFLLASSTMPDEVKEAWIALLPHMTADELDRFTNALAALLADAMTADIDTVFDKKLMSDTQLDAKRANIAGAKLSILFQSLQSRLKKAA